ncbi:hybrid sensor histidine kinase/response regulator [Egbenema bharatensis]|uniref:hybrid sensor histidine kinase/response regulator n=1 Tax=Egbenema bharatensis TaxID=3463334 RepID=UPI003A84A22A
MQILWGAEYIQFYNDAYIPIAGDKHPTGLGQRAAECWQEVWDFSGPLLDRVMATGEATWSEDQPLILHRNGRPDEGYFTFSYTPIWNESGEVAGIFIAVNETTQKILGQRREQALRAEAQAATANLENVLFSISDEFMMFDSNWCFTYINDRAVTALEKTRQELIGQSIWEIYPGAIGTPFYKGLQQAVNTQQATSFEYFCPGEGRWLENRVYPFDQGVSLLRVDITPRKQIEMALQNSEQRLQLALQGADCGTWDYDLISQTLTWSNRCRSMFGIDPAVEMSYAVFSQAIHPDDRERVHQAVEAAITQGQEYDVEMRTLWPNGTVRWVRSMGRVYCTEAGAPYRMAGVAFDISNLKQTEMALRESEERYRVLAEVMPHMVWMADRTGVQFWNQRWYDYIGVQKDDPNVELMGLGSTQFVHPDDQEQTLACWQQALETGEGFQAEQRIRRHDGVYRWFLNRGLPVQDSSGRVTRWVGTVTDIDDQKQLETERARLLEQERVAREAAENANRIKDEFLAVLSHELRSPLNPILGWAKLLQMGKLDAARTAYALETIERNAKLQAQLIDDLLDVSRILRGKLVLDHHPLSLVSVIQDALETVRSISEAKGIRVQTRFDPAPLQMVGDVNRLKQVVWNLLSNAVKFTPQGGQVTVRLDYGEDFAQIQVSDTGKGIHADFLPYVFDRFRQADSTTTRVFGGLGLGLAIAHQIVEMHGGTIQADSAGEGQGATFTVRFPLIFDPVESPLPDSSAQLSTDLKGIHVLVVEDDADSRDLIAIMLEQFGATVTSVSSAAAAMTALSQSKPDILVSDIGMSEMDGYMLMQQVREVTNTSQIPAIALTSYTSEADQQKALSVGFQRHLSKPLEPTQLVEAISALVQSHPKAE